ncbi:hypothetical protein C8Q79DRAFT_353637 [Trametes meyenii]|nr:hypothetical protein C8Q79DRAFT_353637 [Trametes meyenii]
MRRGRPLTGKCPHARARDALGGRGPRATGHGPRSRRAHNNVCGGKGAARRFELWSERSERSRRERQFIQYFHTYHTAPHTRASGNQESSGGHSCGRMYYVERGTGLRKRPEALDALWRSAFGRILPVRHGWLLPCVTVLDR